MGKNPWDDDPDLQMLRGRSSGSTRWGRVFGGILLVGVATFAGAYYLPLFRAHDTLTAEHRRVVEQAQSLERSLSEAKGQLKTVTARKDELEAERQKRESTAADSSSQLEGLKADLASRVDRVAKKGLAQVALGDGGVLVAVADAALFTPHKLELSGPGKQLLCDLAKGVGKRQVTVRAVDSDETQDAALTQKYTSRWALRAARAAAAAEALESKCALGSAQLSVSTLGGTAAGSPALSGAKLPNVHLEFALRPPAS
jgi:flagellar motor protein MotB